jgi:hypothetical protein
MDTLLAAAAAATAAEDAAAAAAAGGDDGDCNMRAGAAERGQQGDMGAEVEEAEDQDEEAGICVGPEHQADLPLVRPLPGFAAAVALMELKKSGLKGPGHEEALRLALEVRGALLEFGDCFWARGGDGPVGLVVVMGL